MNTAPVDTSLEQRAKRVTEGLPQQQRAKVIAACAGLDRVARKDAMGRVVLDESHLRATLVTQLPGSFVDRLMDKAREGFGEQSHPGAPELMSERELNNERDLINRGERISWIQLGELVSTEKELPPPETMEGLGLTHQSSNAEVRDVILSRLPDFPTEAFEGEATVRRMAAGIDRLNRSSDATSGSMEMTESTSAAATEFSWSDVWYCMKDKWFPWLMLCLTTFVFILFATGGNWAIALILALVYVPFWAVVFTVACIMWALN